MPISPAARRAVYTFLLHDAAPAWVPITTSAMVPINENALTRLRVVHSPR